MQLEVAQLQGAAALPRRNGELVFDEPWESRAFGLAVTAAESGAYEWEEFRQGLIAEIAAWEGAQDTWSYYARWLATFERLIVEKGLVSREELTARMADLETLDDHHDHDHGGEA